MSKLENIDSSYSLREKIKIIPQQGEIWLGRFDKIKEISKDYRPVLIISNNLKNEFTDEVIVATFTSDFLEEIGEYEIFVQNTKENGLDKPSKILADSIFTLNKKLRLEKRLGRIDEATLLEVVELIKNSVLTMRW